MRRKGIFSFYEAVFRLSQDKVSKGTKPQSQDSDRERSKQAEPHLSICCTHSRRCVAVDPDVVLDI